MWRRIFSSVNDLGFSQTARSLYWVFSGNSLSIVLAFFTTILIARYLTKEEFGIYLALYTFANLGADIGDLGIGPALSRFIPPLAMQNKTGEINKLLSTALGIELAITGIIIILMVFKAKFLAVVFFGQTEVANILITTGMLFSLILFNYAMLALTSLKRFKETAVVNISSSVIRLFLLVIVALWFKVTLASVLLIYALAPLSGWAYALIHLPKGALQPRLKRKEVRQMARFSGYLGLQKIFIAVSSRLDFLMILPLAGAYEAGVYGAAARISQIFPFFISSFSQVLAPKFAEFKQAKDARNFFKKSALVVILFMFAFTGFYVFAHPLIAILFPKYIESIPVFRALLISMIGFILATPFVSFIIYTLKKPQIIAISSLMQLLVIFLFNLIVIPRIGRFGPAVGIGLGNLIVLIIAVSTTWYSFARKI